MKASIKTYTPVACSRAARHCVARLVGIHSMAYGMDMPPTDSTFITDHYESATRIGLDRVGANYAHTIPFAVALYNDLWQANEQRLVAARLPKQLDRFGPYFQMHPVATLGDPAHAVLEVRVALEMLGNTRFTLPGMSADHELIGLTPELHLPGMEISTPDQSGSALLWRRAAHLATYLTTPWLREVTLQRVAAEIEAGDDQVVLLAHGLGSLIGYDLLLRRPDLPVRCLVTLGSPLGLPSVRSVLAQLQGRTTAARKAAILPFPSHLPRWINLYNSADTVSASHLLSQIYTPASGNDSRHVEDIDTGKLGFQSLSSFFCGYHPATYLASKTAGMVLRSVVES